MRQRGWWEDWRYKAHRFAGNVCNLMQVYGIGIIAAGSEPASLKLHFSSEQ